MGVTTATGLISGIDSASLIQQLISIAAAPIRLLEAKVSDLDARKAALSDVTARMLSYKVAAYQLSLDATFDAKDATSSDENRIIASASTSAVAGSYAFTVGQMAQTSQAASNGFVDSNLATVGEGQLSFEIGGGFLDRETALSALNGGDGVDPGSIRVTDLAGASEVLDLSTAVTIQDVVNIVSNASKVNVTASVVGDKLKLVSTTGSGTFKVEEVGGNTTAKDLGILTSTTGTTIWGEAIQKIKGATRLELLNDGLGIRGVTGNDLRLNFKDGTTADVDLGTATTVQGVMDLIEAAGTTKVSVAISGDNQGLTLTDTSGGGGGFSVTALNNSNAALDLGLLNVTAINSATGKESATGNVLIGRKLVSALNSVLLREINGGSSQYDAAGTLVSDYDGVTDGTFTVTDRAGNTDTVTIAKRKQVDLASAASAGATYLEIADGDVAGFYVNNRIRVTNGTTTDYRIITKVENTGGANTRLHLNTALTNAYLATNPVFVEHESLNDALNAISDTNTGSQNDFRTTKLTASVNPEGNGIIVKDNTSSTTTGITIQNTDTARDLGIVTRLEGRVDTGGTDTFTDTGLVGYTGTLVGLTAVVLEGTNKGASAAITGFNSATGVVSFGAATFGTTDTTSIYEIRQVTVQDTSANGKDIDVQYVGMNTKLADLNSKKGVFAGAMRFTSRTNISFSVDISNTTTYKTVGDVVNAINTASTSALAGIQAVINDTGDGILIKDTSGGTGTLKVEEVSGGRTAKDLNILGSATTAAPTQIDGSYEINVTVSATDTLEKVRDAVNALGRDVTATIVNDGSPFTPYRLNLVSKNSGMAGKLVVDTRRSSLTFTETVEAKDAAVLFGSVTGGSSPILLTGSSNTVTNAVQGLTLNLLATGGPVTVTVARDEEGITSSVDDFVEKFNDVIGTIDDYTSYNPDTKEAGVLLGDRSVQLAEDRMYDGVTKDVENLPTSLSLLSEVGIKIDGETGLLEFDSGKFSTEMAEDFTAVKNLFTYRINRALSGNGGKAYASSEASGYPAKNAANGNTKSEDFGSNVNGWRDDSAGTDTLTVEFPEPIWLDSIKLWHHKGTVISNFQIQYRKTATGDFITERSFSGNTDSDNLVGFGLPILAQAVRLNILSTGNSELVEFEAFEDIGLADAIDRDMDSLTNSVDGLMTEAMNSLDDQIEDTQERIEDMNESLDAEEERLVRQFSAMEEALAEMQSISQILASQLTTISSS